MSRYIPKKDTERTAFFKTFNAGIKEMGTQLGLSAEDINSVGSSTQTTLDKADAVQALFTGYKNANTEKKSDEERHSKLIVFTVNKMKNSGNWSDAAAKTLGVYTQSSQVDLDNIKPIPTLRIITGFINLFFEKKGLTGVNVYGKINDDKDWTFLGTPTTSPFIDERPLRVQGVAEIRYYKIVGVKNDKEVGHASDVIWIAFAG